MSNTMTPAELIAALEKGHESVVRYFGSDSPDAQKSESIIAAVSALVADRDALREAATEFFDAQANLDNNEMMGINAAPYEKLIRERNAARSSLEAALAGAAPPSQSVASIHAFQSAGGDEIASPLERLRFFLSIALKGQDWLDVEPLLDALPVALPDGYVAVPHGVIDALRFMCETWAGVDEWAYAHAGGDALTKYPVIQGTGNQMRLRRIARQRYDHTAIPDALKWVESIAAAPAGEGVGNA